RKRKLADVEIENLQGKRTKTHETRSKNTARKAATTLTERMDENLEHTSIQEDMPGTINRTKGLLSNTLDMTCDVTALKVELSRKNQTFNEINVDGNAQSEERIEIEATSASINENNTEDMKTAQELDDNSFTVVFMKKKKGKNVVTNIERHSLYKKSKRNKIQQISFTKSNQI
ncbi:7513_t:CDS:2, partial [Racocetra fulgida]